MISMLLYLEIMGLNQTKNMICMKDLKDSKKFECDNYYDDLIDEEDKKKS